MDFKVAGTTNGITALQMDIKIQGITKEIMQVALAQAKEARLHILGEMTAAMATMPFELKLLMWLPAMPAKTCRILQSPISSASSSACWIEATVVSMLTTTPFLRPLEALWPRPTIS